MLFLPLSEVFEYRLEHVSKEISDEERTKEQRVLSEVDHHEVVVMCGPLHRCTYTFSLAHIEYLGLHFVSKSLLFEVAAALPVEQLVAQSQGLPCIMEVLQGTTAGGWPKRSNTQTLELY